MMDISTTLKSRCVSSLLSHLHETSKVGFIWFQIDQSVFTVLPAKPGIRPGMVLLFELYLLRGAMVPTDRVVGWGVFPVADAGFDSIEGK